MSNGTVVLLMALLMLLMVGYGEAATSTSTSTLSGPLAKIDLKDTEISPTRGVPNGAFTIAQHFALDSTRLDPQDYIVALTQQDYDYLAHDALIKTMPQGLLTYSLAEHAEATSDSTKLAFRLRQGLKFHDGQPLTTADVAWSYQNYRGVSAKLFKDKLDSRRPDTGVERVDDRIIIGPLEKIQARMGLGYLFIARLAAVAHIGHQIAVMYLGKLVEVAAGHQVACNLY